jgi:hypothetical protein
MLLSGLCHICLFDFIRVEGGGAKFMKYFKGEQAIKVWETLLYSVEWKMMGEWWIGKAVEGSSNGLI